MVSTTLSEQKPYVIETRDQEIDQLHKFKGLIHNETLIKTVREMTLLITRSDSVSEGVSSLKR